MFKVLRELCLATAAFGFLSGFGLLLYIAISTAALQPWPADSMVLLARSMALGVVGLLGAWFASVRIMNDPRYITS